MSANTPEPRITPADRLALTLCLAIIVHAVVILGITFAPPEDPKLRYEPMDILLVPEESEEPEEADYLAQANLEGGGESEEPERPSTPLPPPLPEPVPTVAAPEPVTPVPPPPEPEPVPEPPAPEPVPPPPSEPETVEEPPAPEPPETPQQIAAETPEPAPAEAPEPPPEPPEEPVARAEPPPEPKPETPPEPEPEPAPDAAAAPAERRPSAAELVSSSLEAAALSAEIQRKLKAKAERPRRTFISASTKEFKYASYMEAWRQKVERIGNLNYPEEARQRGLTGSLILDVALKPDGSVEQITIRRSSGSKILDDAAIRIVKLAAPFAPFPDNIRAETDILHITRTWQFMQGDRFQ